MIGRDRELEQLGEVFARASGGDGSLLLLTGEAGVGKTRLAEAAVSAASLACLRGVAAEHGASPYAPVTAVLRQHFRRDGAGLSREDPLFAHLGVLLPELGPPPDVTDRETLFEAVRAAFAAISAREPTVVFFDDLQWADAATLELLPSLAEAAEEWPLLILAAYRSEEIARGHPLRRLRTDLRRAGRLIRAHGRAAGFRRNRSAGGGSPRRRTWPDATRGALRPHARSPVLRGGACGGAARRRPARGRNGMASSSTKGRPSRSPRRSATRSASEPRASRRRAGRLSRWRPSSASRSTSTCSPGSAATPGLGEVFDRGLLQEREPGRAAFRHDLVREAVLAATHWPTRRSLHRELAGLLEARAAEPKLTAEHWLAAGERARALPLLVEAARRFCAVHAYRDATKAARVALEIWPEGTDEPGRLDVLDQLGRCAQLCGELAEAGRVLEEVAAGLARRRRPGAPRRSEAAAGHRLRAAGRPAASGSRSTGGRGRFRGRRPPRRGARANGMSLPTSSGTIPPG